MSRSSVGLVVDSSALLPADLVERTGAQVVPITVTIDGVDYAEGVDLTTDAFYQLLQERGPDVALATAQPTPAEFVAAYQRAADGGATSVVAVLVGSGFSGTVDSARLAARHVEIPVACVDTGQASFGVGMCAVAAADALEAGANAEEAASAASALAPTIESVFILQAIELARASGRFGPALDHVEVDDRAAGPSAIPVLRFGGGDLTVVAEVDSLDEAVAAMADAITAAGAPLRVASGLADPQTAPVTEALEAELAGRTSVRELLRYRVGPSVAANTGPGTAGAFFHPVGH